LENNEKSVYLFSAQPFRQRVVKPLPNQTSVELILYRSAHRPPSLTLDLRSVLSPTFSVTLKGAWKADTFADGARFTILKHPNLTIITPSNLPANNLWWNVEPAATPTQTQPSSLSLVYLVIPPPQSLSSSSSFSFSSECGLPFVRFFY
jgi:hypothetical protein